MGRGGSQCHRDRDIVGRGGKAGENSDGRGGRGGKHPYGGSDGGGWQRTGIRQQGRRGRMAISQRPVATGTEGGEGTRMDSSRPAPRPLMRAGGAAIGCSRGGEE